ncbi:MAG TPA: ACT domain-containing protein [Thermoplasmata archaeon]|nr:ACT domain-containing protein [Thermoplasmata archaeon]
MVLREISLTLPNRPGALAGVARTLAKERINVAAISVDSAGGRGLVRLIVSDPDRSTALLTAAGYETEVREMLAVRLEDRAGSFLRVLEALEREKINIQSVAILVAREGNMPLVVISTNDLPRARRLLQQAGFASRAAERLVTNDDLIASAPTIPSESVGLLL